jgi:hypothetical protein
MVYRWHLQSSLNDTLCPVPIQVIPWYSCPHPWIGMCLYLHADDTIVPMFHIGDTSVPMSYPGDTFVALSPPYDTYAHVPSRRQLCLCPILVTPLCLGPIQVLSLFLHSIQETPLCPYPFKMTTLFCCPVESMCLCFIQETPLCTSIGTPMPMPHTNDTFVPMSRPKDSSVSVFHLCVYMSHLCVLSMCPIYVSRRSRRYLFCI